MSSGELLLTFGIALVVFGPNKLPMLATHLAVLLRKISFFKEQAALFWQQQINVFQLQENQRKAEAGDRQYERQGTELDVKK